MEPYDRARVYQYMERNEAGRVADAGQPVPASQCALDAMADVRTCLVNTRVRFGSALWLAQHEGSRAVVAVLDGDAYLAGLHAAVAVRAGRKALRALRG